MEPQAQLKDERDDAAWTDSDVVRLAALQLNTIENETPTRVNNAIHVEADTVLNAQRQVNQRASLPSSLHLSLAPTLSAMVSTTPASPVNRRHSSVAAMQTIATRSARSLSPTSSEFYLTFGPLGVPMVVAFVSSAVTLFFMAIVQVIPTQIANYLMKTTDLDEGEFWMLVKPPPALVVLSALMLVLCGCCYTALAYVMVFSRKRLLHQPATRPSSIKQGVVGKGDREHGADNTHDPTTARMPVRSRAQELLHVFTVAINRTVSSEKPSRRVVSGKPRSMPQAMRLVHKFAHPDGLYFAYYNAMFDLPKLIFQTAALGTYLTEGFPLPLIYFYVSMLMVNWSISFYRFQRAALDRNLVITRLFYLFDLFFAVFAPVIVLAYAYSHFVLDRGIFAARQRTLSPGMFDRIARIFADPVQVDVFRYAFHHLQLTKTWYVACKCFLNVLVVYKWKKIIAYLVNQRHANTPHTRLQAGPVTTLIQPPQNEQPKSSRDWRAVVKRVVQADGKRRHLVVGMIVFLTSMVAIPTYVSVSITSSLNNCASIPQCRVVSYRWSRGETECPCIVFIDRDQAPRTFDAWINAPDATPALVLAAKSGHLKTVQVVNRAIQELPTELRHCTELEQLILVYSKTQAFPDWVGEFHNLRYLHVESDFINFPLHTLPLDMFSRTHKLRFIRFGGLAKLPIFPSLHGLHELTTFVLSLPHALTELPDFSNLENLKTLIIADATHAKTLPSLQPLKSLTYFSLFRRNAMCCNGFIDGLCDLATFQCMPRANEDPVVCESSRLPQKDRELLKRIDGFVCSANLTSDVADSEPTVLSTDGVCGGVQFKQCQLNGRSGMCYNGRMQVIHCDVFGEYEAMRRLEIIEDVGPACDPKVEAWMGCK